MKYPPLVVALLLAGCATPKVIEKPVITYVEKRVECPSKEEREKLRAERPVPLRQTEMPGHAVPRVGAAEAQLGLYEAEGGWADRVDAALDRCQRP